MLLFVDNYDSFSFTIVSYFEELKAKYNHKFDIKIINKDELTLKAIKSLPLTKIVLSPGPHHPRDSKLSLELIDFYHEKLPILGICLGHQCIAHYFGVEIVHSNDVMHGTTSEIFHFNCGLFHNLKNPLTQTRYNSLTVGLESLENNSFLELNAFTKKDNKVFEVMALKHIKFPTMGVQFHPEAILSKNGHEILNNFLNIEY